MVGFLKSIAERGGLETNRQKVAPHRDNLIVRYVPSGKVRQRILLAPHFDTVSGDLKRIFTPRVSGDRLYGRGACDTKGSVAAMFSALRSVADHPDRPRHSEVIFAGLVDEESRQLGSRRLAGSRIRANLAIVGEPTRLEAVTAHKGNVWLKLVFTGTAAHGSKPALGVNAVHRAAQVVCALEEQLAPRLAQRIHPRVGCATVNVGRIMGGIQPNIVPDLCELEIDRRLLPGEDYDEAVREMLRVVKELGLKCSHEDMKGVRCPPMESDPGQPLIQRFLQAAGKRRTRGVDYFCDAAILHGAGIPAMVFGPGDVAQAHTADEWISLASLDRATDILKRFLLSLP